MFHTAAFQWNIWFQYVVFSFAGSSAFLSSPSSLSPPPPANPSHSFSLHPPCSGWVVWPAVWNGACHASFSALFRQTYLWLHSPDHGQLHPSGYILQTIGSYIHPATFSRPWAATSIWLHSPDHGQLHPSGYILQIMGSYIHPAISLQPNTMWR